MNHSTEAQNKAIVLEAFDTSQAESKSGRPMFGDRFPV